MSYAITCLPEFKAICPAFVGACLEAFASDRPTPAELTAEIAQAAEVLKTQYDATSIKQRPSIAATRAAYKLAGKDPSRYRPSCEQLARRVLTGRDLYTVTTLVDIGNLVSLKSGYSIGVLDAAQIKLEAAQDEQRAAQKNLDAAPSTDGSITLGLGRTDEPYEAIGRGQLNIADMPVYRDALGAFATPTSDSTRTMISASTRHILVLVNGYDGNKAAVGEAADLARALLERYANAQLQDISFY